MENNLFDESPEWTILVKHRHNIKLTHTMGFGIQSEDFGMLIPGNHCCCLRSTWIHSKSTNGSAETTCHPDKPHLQRGPGNNCVNTKGPHHPGSDSTFVSIPVGLESKTLADNGNLSLDWVAGEALIQYIVQLVGFPRCLTPGWSYRNLGIRHFWKNKIITKSH